MSPVAVLVGPPGAGKTTTGRLLAGMLGVDLLDTDAAVEDAVGTSVAEVFTTLGEPAFRDLEEAAVAAALARHAGVVSVGGGAVLSAATRAALAGHVVVHLDVGTTEGVRRTGLGAGRPLLAGVNPRATYRALLDARAPLYAEVATLRVLTDGRTARHVAAEIAEHLRARPDPTPPQEAHR